MWFILFGGYNPFPPTTGGDPGGGGNDGNELHCDKTVIDAMKKAWTRSGNGTRNTEAGFLVYELNGQIATVNLPNTNQSLRISFKPSELLPTGATLLAIFHTHPTEKSDKPSAGEAPSDKATSSKLLVPVYVMHRNGLSRIDSNGKITERIRKNLEWLKQCEVNHETVHTNAI